jgi:hypothetical protein
MGEILAGNNHYNSPVLNKNTCTIRERDRADPESWTTYLEYSGAGLGIVGWLGVRQIGSTGAQELGFFIWIVSGLILIAWGFHAKARGIMLINAVNVMMAASAFLAMV